MTSAFALHSNFCRKDKPSCKLVYVTPERIAGNLPFQEILNGLHRKVSFVRTWIYQILGMVAKGRMSEYFIRCWVREGLSHNLQGQLAGFVVDEAHCVRYFLFLSFIAYIHICISRTWHICVYLTVLISPCMSLCLDAVWCVLTLQKVSLTR